MIVAGPAGFIKNAYRKFTIRGTAPTPEDAGATIAPGDDYGMMREVLTRRFARALKEDPARETGSWPDLVLIDGGEEPARGGAAGAGGSRQSPTCRWSLSPRDRTATPGASGSSCRASRPAASTPRAPCSISFRGSGTRRTASRSARIGRAASRVLGTSPLDEIPGVGAKRKKALLHHFGSARGVARAGLADLAQVDGISEAVAKKIYDHFHAEG